MQAFIDKISGAERLQIILVTVVFLLLYYVVYLSDYLNTLTIEIDFSANQAGLLTFYWPTPDNAYKKSDSKSLQYQAGENRIRVQTRAFDEKLSLRIDPDSTANKVQLSRLSLKRFNNKITLDSRQLAASIVATHSLTWVPGDNAIDMSLAKNDPQLLLGNLPFPKTSFIFWFGLLLVLTVQAYLFVRLSRLSQRMQSKIIPVVFAICLLAYLAGGLMMQDSNLLALTFSSMASIGVCASLLIAKSMVSSENLLGIGGSALIIIPFIAFLLVQLFKTTHTEEFREALHAQYDALNTQEPEGPGNRLIHARDALEEVFSRKFNIRQPLLNINAESKVFVFGFSPTDKVIIGQDDWFFEGYGGRRVEKDIVRSFDNVTDYMGQNPFTRQELEAWRIALEERYYWLKERGIDYIFALAPTKALIYPEKLPERLLAMKNRLDRPGRYDQLLGYLKEKSIVPVVDLKKALLREKGKNRDLPLFYRTDFHWNYYGAFIAYDAIVDGINDAYPHFMFEKGSMNEFTIEKKPDWVHRRFMHMVGLDPERHKDDTYYTFFPKQDSPYAQIYDFDKNGISDYSLPGMTTEKFADQPFTVRKISNPNGKLPLMYIIGDSFIEKTLGYFSLHSKESMNFRVVTEFPLTPFSDTDKQPQLVIQEVLNMYLLQPPPVNPPEVRKARTRALEKMMN